MDIKPLFQTGTIRIVAPKTNIKHVDTKIIKDPDGIVPSSIYRVIKWESIRQKLTLLLLNLIIIAISIWIILLSTVYQSMWVGYLIPIILLMLLTYKVLITFFEMKTLKRAVIRYREDLKYNLVSTPPFLARMYLALHRKQVAHNWITFTIIFYGGIFTLLLWALKDVDWWIFNFKLWIGTLFGNPWLMSWIFTISLIFVAVLHIIMTVQRKKKIIEMDSFYGSQLAPQSEVEIIKTNYNKMYRRLFFISVLIVLVIPLFIWIVYKTIKRRK